MKKPALIFLILLVYFNCQAQTEKGSFQLGIGGLPIIYPNSLAETGYSLRANFGYFPTNRLAIGVIPFFGKVEDMKSVGASIYFRYYITNKRTSIFMEAGAGFGNLKYETTPQLNGTLNTINIGPGIHYLFKNKLSVELILQYARLRNVKYPEDTYTGNTLIPTLGIQYFIWK